jgi:hypothetical protein
VAATSDNETAASAVLHNGIVTITGNRTGIAKITITTDRGMAVLTATVEKPDGARLGAYQERNGSLVLDPADALEQSEYTNTADSNNGTHTWTLARNGLRVVPMANSGAQANWLATNASQAQTLLTAGPTDQSADSLQAATAVSGSSSPIDAGTGDRELVASPGDHGGWWRSPGCAARGGSRAG